MISSRKSLSAPVAPSAMDTSGEPNISIGNPASRPASFSGSQGHNIMQTFFSATDRRSCPSSGEMLNKHSILDRSVKKYSGLGTKHSRLFGGALSKMLMVLHLIVSVRGDNWTLFYNGHPITEQEFSGIDCKPLWTNDVQWANIKNGFEDAEKTRILQFLKNAPNGIFTFKRRLEGNRDQEQNRSADSIITAGTSTQGNEDEENSKSWSHFSDNSTSESIQPVKPNPDSSGSDMSLGSLSEPTREPRPTARKTRLNVPVLNNQLQKDDKPKAQFISLEKGSGSPEPSGTKSSFQVAGFDDSNCDHHWEGQNTAHCIAVMERRNNNRHTPTSDRGEIVGGLQTACLLAQHDLLNEIESEKFERKIRQLDMNQAINDKQIFGMKQNLCCDSWKPCFESGAFVIEMDTAGVWKDDNAINTIKEDKNAVTYWWVVNGSIVRKEIDAIEKVSQEKSFTITLDEGGRVYTWERNRDFTFISSNKDNNGLEIHGTRVGVFVLLHKSFENYQQEQEVVKNKKSCTPMETLASCFCTPDNEKPLDLYTEYRNKNKDLFTKALEKRYVEQSTVCNRPAMLGFCCCSCLPKPDFCSGYCSWCCCAPRNVIIGLAMILKVTAMISIGGSFPTFVQWLESFKITTEPETIEISADDLATYYGIPNADTTDALTTELLKQLQDLGVPETNNTIAVTNNIGDVQKILKHKGIEYNHSEEETLISINDVGLEVGIFLASLSLMCVMGVYCCYKKPIECD